MEATPSVAGAIETEAAIGAPPAVPVEGALMALVIRLVLWAVILTYVVVADPDEDEELANWSATRQLRVAYTVARRLCHLDVARHGQLPCEPRGEVRFTIEHDDAERPVVAVDVVPTLVTADRPVPRTLQVGLFYE